MFRSIPFLACLSAALAWAQAVPQPAKPTSQAARPRNLDLESFDIVWTTVRDTHWQQRPGGLDWDAIRDEYRPRVENAASSDEARGAMIEMLSRLHQTHFGIVPGALYTAIDTDDLSTARGTGAPGIELRVLKGEQGEPQAVVTRVDAGSPAEQAGVRTGWIVKTAGGRELASLIEQAGRNPEIHELQLTRALEARLSGNAGGSVDVTFVDGADKEVVLRLPLAAPRGVRTEFGNLPPQFVWFEERRIDGKIGYIRFNAFLDIPRLMPAFEKAVNGCAACSGLIIDLRGNPGGIGGMAMGMAGFVVNKSGLKLGTMQTRDTQLNFVVNPRPKVFSGPVAVLLDANSASTAEIFAGGLQDMGRARVFGTRSAAAALPSVLTRLPNGDGFQHAIANYVSASGKALEGQGVKPDEEVVLTRRELLAGHDAVIDHALEWIALQGPLAHILVK